eukprot:m.108143 g.108143  ORF g.108143 m.108143 type:complete len:93 (-) comp16945_c1_seq3:2545-2823(-)
MRQTSEAQKLGINSSLASHQHCLDTHQNDSTFATEINTDKADAMSTHITQSSESVHETSGTMYRQWRRKVTYRRHWAAPRSLHELRRAHLED